MEDNQELSPHKPFVLRGAMLADGSGDPLRLGDVLVVDGLIAGVGTVDVPEVATILDCSGYVVAPGFVDAHSHSDLQVLEGRREKLLQGVTSEVVGNCGFSPYPRGTHAGELRAFANGILCGAEGWGWDSAQGYFDALKSATAVASVYSLVGHGSLRIAVAGNRMDALSEAQMLKMEALLGEAFAEGATGFSTGLMYAPGSGAPRSELERLCTVVASHGKIYCTHMRDYGYHLLQAIDEQIALADVSGCRLQISHLQAVGKPNRDLNERALERIEEAHVRGIDVAFDCYPYTAGSTVMTQLLPQWTLEGGIAALLRRLENAGERATIAAEMLAGMVHEWDELLISAVESEANASTVGKTLAELGALRSQDPSDVVFDLLIEEKGQVNVLEFNQSEDNLRRNLNHPLAIIISDGFYVKGRPHPRLHGTFPELLGNLCRDRSWMNIETAIRKITGFPAERFGIENRGYLRRGYVADITVFDPLTIRSKATYVDPAQSPEGILEVFKAGRSLLAGHLPAA